MNYENVAKIIQIHGTDINNVSRKVNAYLRYEWKVIGILQLKDEDWSCPVFVLGHLETNPPEPIIDVYSKEWS